MQYGQSLSIDYAVPLPPPKARPICKGIIGTFRGLIQADVDACVVSPNIHQTKGAPRIGLFPFALISNFPLVDRSFRLFRHPVFLVLPARLCKDAAERR